MTKRTYDFDKFAQDANQLRFKVGDHVTTPEGKGVVVKAFSTPSDPHNPGYYVVEVLKPTRVQMLDKELS